MKVLAVLSVLVILFLASPAISQVPDDKLIVPGQRIGKWTLQMTLDDLVRMNGKQNMSASPEPPFSPISRMRSYYPDSLDDIWWHLWINVYFSAATRGRDEQRIEYIFIHSSEYKTEKDIALGATREQVEAAYGQPTAMTPAGLPGRVAAVEVLRLIYDQLGLAVTVGRGAAMGGGVFVFRPGAAKTIWKF